MRMLLATSLVYAAGHVIGVCYGPRHWCMLLATSLVHMTAFSQGQGENLVPPFIHTRGSVSISLSLSLATSYHALCAIVS